MTTGSDGLAGYGGFRTRAQTESKLFDGVGDTEMESLWKKPGDAQDVSELVPGDGKATTIHIPRLIRKESYSDKDDKGPPQGLSSSVPEALKKAQFAVRGLGSDPRQLREFARYAAQPELRQALQERADELERAKHGEHVVVDLPSAHDPAARARRAHTLRHAAHHVPDQACKRALLECADRMELRLETEAPPSRQPAPALAAKPVLDRKSYNPSGREVQWREALIQAEKDGEALGNDPAGLNELAGKAPTDVLRRALRSRAMVSEAIADSRKFTTPEQFQVLVNEAMHGLEVPSALAIKRKPLMPTIEPKTKDTKLEDIQGIDEHVGVHEPQARQMLARHRIDLEDGRRRIHEDRDGAPPVRLEGQSYDDGGDDVPYKLIRTRAQDKKHIDLGTEALRVFRYHLTTPQGRAIFQARSVGNDEAELLRYAHARRELLGKGCSPEKLDDEVASDLIYQAYVRRAYAVRLADGVPCSERVRMNRINRLATALTTEPHGDNEIRRQAKAVFSEVGTAILYRGFPHEEGPLERAILLRAELSLHMGLDWLCVQDEQTGQRRLDVGRYLVNAIAERVEAQGISTPSALRQAIAEGRVSLEPTPEDYDDVMKWVVGDRTDLTGMLAVMEDRFVSSGGPRSEFRNAPICQALSLRGVVIDALREIVKQTGSVFIIEIAAEIARKCERSPTDDPPGLGIRSGAELHRIISNMVRSDHIRSGLVDFAKEVRNGLIPVLTLLLSGFFDDQIPDGNPENPLFTKVGIQLAAYFLHSATGFAGSVNAPSELLPARGGDDKRGHVMHSMVTGGLGSLVQLAPLPARPALYVCQFFSTLFTGMGRSSALRLGVMSVPRFLNRDPATPQELDQVRRARAQPSFSSTLKYWWGQLRHQPGATWIPPMRLPGNLTHMIAQRNGQPGQYELAVGVETASRLFEGILKAREDYKFNGPPPPPD